MDLSSVVGFILGFGVTLAGILMGSDLRLFIDLPSIIFVFGGTFAFLLVSFPLPEVLSMFRPLIHVFFANKPLNDKIVLGKEPNEEDIKKVSLEMRIGIEIYKRIPYLTLPVGAVAFMIGSIKILNNIGDQIKIGRAVAFCCLSLLYAIIIAFFICIPIRFKLERRLAELQMLQSGELDEYMALLNQEKKQTSE